MKRPRTSGAKQEATQQDEQQEHAEQQEQHAMMMMSMMDRGDIELTEDRRTAAPLSILEPFATLGSSNHHHDDEDDVENDCDEESPEHNFYNEDSTLGDDDYGSGSDDGDSDDDVGSREVTRMFLGDDVTDVDDYEYDDEEEERRSLALGTAKNRDRDSSEHPQQQSQFMSTNISSSQENQKLRRHDQGLQEDSARFQQSQPSLSAAAAAAAAAESCPTTPITRSGSSGTLSKLPHNQRTVRQQRGLAKSLPASTTTSSRDPNTMKQQQQQQQPGLHQRHHRSPTIQNGAGRASLSSSLIFRNGNDILGDIELGEQQQLDDGSQEPLLLLKHSIKTAPSTVTSTASTTTTTTTTTYSPRGSCRGVGGRGRRSMVDLMLMDASAAEPGTNLELPFWESLKDRGGWLVGLLVLQSMSSFIISRNEKLLQEHIVIVQFLTMLVGAGGNAGNQASVRGMVLLHRCSCFLHSSLCLFRSCVDFPQESKSNTPCCPLAMFLSKIFCIFGQHDR
jgi:hypothetical protein